MLTLAKIAVDNNYPVIDIDDIHLLSVDAIDRFLVSIPSKNCYITIFLKHPLSIQGNISRVLEFSYQGQEKISADELHEVIRELIAKNRWLDFDRSII